MEWCNKTINSSANISAGNGSDPGSLHNAQLEELVTYYTMKIGVPIVCAFGMIGNVLNFMVLTREKISRSLTKMEKSAHIGLIGLAVSDFMFCLLAFMYTRFESQDTYSELGIVLYFNWLSGPLITWFIVTSTWLTVAMAGERYLAVCHPFKARKLISLRKTRLIIGIIYLVCLALTIPLGFERIIAHCTDEDGQDYYKIKSRPEFTDYIISIRRLVWAILFDFIPCVALLFFNACLIYKIHHAKQLRNAMAPGQKNEVLLTKYPRELFSYNSNSASSNNSLYKDRPQSFSHTPAPRCQTMKNKTRNYSTKSWRSSPESLSRNATPQKRQMKARRRQTDNALNSVTATLVAVVVLFLILVSPSEILKFVYITTGGSKTHTFKIIKNVTNLMQAINFSVNFVLYCAVNKSFRSSLAAIFCFFCKRGRDAFKLKSLERAYCHKIEFSESES